MMKSLNLWASVRISSMFVCVRSFNPNHSRDSGESVLDWLFQSQTCGFSAPRLVQQILQLVCFGPSCCRSQLSSSGRKLSRNRQKPLNVGLFRSFSGWVEGKSSARGQDLWWLDQGQSKHVGHRLCGLQDPRDSAARVSPKPSAGDLVKILERARRPETATFLIQTHKT